MAMVVTPRPRDAHAERGARDGQGIDEITDETVDVLTQKRVETGESSSDDEVGSKRRAT